jgi:4a-hydroxytetrahydrobiopterin dehydratase
MSTRLETGEAARRMPTLHADWTIDADSTSITRRFVCDTFAAAVQLANVAAWLGEKHNHHPDVTFGWGYCTVRYTSHDVGGLSGRDFRSAAALDALVA